MADQPPLADADLTRLRDWLPAPLQSWQGSHLPLVLDYARAWKQTGDDAFFGKTVAGLSTVRNYQKDYYGAYETVAFGDGSAKSFPLRVGVLDGVARTYVAPPKPAAVIRGADDTDGVVFYSDFRRAFDASGEYARGTDWTHSGDDPGNALRWLPGGRRPAAGSRYTVEYTSRIEGGKFYNAPVSGGVLTLPDAAPAGHAVYSMYVYSPPGGLPYQETTGGGGGFNLVYVDSSFAVKYLDSLVLALEIVWDDPRLPADLKAELLDLLPRWFDYVTASGYMKDSLQSNYGVGGESFRVRCAFYLEGIGHPRGAEFAKAVTDFWRAHQPQITGPAPSLRGGFWAEGWNYGNLSTRKLLDLAEAFAARGEDIGGIRGWAAEVATFLAHASPGDSGKYLFDGGDWFAWPAPFPADLAARLAAFGAPVPADRTQLPTDYAAPGTGVYLSRSDWSDDGMMVSFQAGPVLACDHQQYTPGQLQIWLGDQPLLMNGPVLLRDQSGATKSKLGNCLLIDGTQNYPPGMGYWYDGRGFVKAYTPGPGRTVIRSEPGAAFSRNDAPDCGGPCKSWGRDVTFLKGQKVVVCYDRVTVRGDYPWRVQGCLYAVPDADGWYRMALGSRTLYATALSPDGPVTPEVAADGRLLRFALATPARQGRIVTVFAADAKPAVSRDSFTLTVGGEAVALDPDWPAPLPDAPAPGPTPNPTPSPTVTGPPDWQVKYGRLGHAIPLGDSTPGLVTTAAPAFAGGDWPAGSSCWYHSAAFTLAVAAPGPCRLAVYALDGDHKGRAERVEVLGADGAVLKAADVTDFGDGRWLTFDVPGPVAVRVTPAAGPNAVLGGVFLDPPPAPPAPAWAETERVVQAGTDAKGDWRKTEVIERRPAA